MPKPGSSPDTTTVETPADAVVATTDVKPADSSSADASKGDKGDNILSAVKAALAPKTETAPDSDKPDPKSDKPTTEIADKEGAGEGEEDEFSPEDFARLNKKTAKRFGTLLQQKTELSKEVETLRPLKDKAGQFDKVVEFCNEAGLTGDEVNEIFKLGRSLKRDPEKALAQLKPIYESLQRMYGEVLPDDLKQRVAEGQLTEDDARTIARSRTKEKLSTDEVKRLQDADAARKADETQAAFVGEVKSKLTEWETSKEAKDPDWKLKQPQVMRAFKLSVQEKGFPKTSAEVIQLAEAALKEVDGELKVFIPRRTEVTTTTDAATSLGTTPKPTTMLEAAKAGLARTAA